MLNESKRLKELSIFFPLFNEEENIERLVDEAIKIFSNFAETFEILLINDGSTDNTEKIAKKLETKYPQVKLISQNNRGYGGALKTGFKNSQYDWIFFSDGDLQFDFSEIEKFIPYIKDYDLIIGFRKNRAEGFKRDLIAKMLKVWNKIFLNFPTDIKDIDCAFKLMKKEAIYEVLPLVSTGSMVSTEFLLKAKRNNYKIKQIGVTHYARKHGNPSGSNKRVILKAIKETFVLKRLMK